MKIYLVGGAVRDIQMGLEPKDHDFVVVGSSPEEMLALGYQQVGASFPVFLKDGCEYALARTERKNGVGYKGFDTVFDSSVTLEDDLIRRDLTINSMAMDPDTGKITDPYGGLQDIKNGVLRATSDAFAEDPVRVLRTARFAARYGFAIAQDTINLMHEVSPELDHVPQERVWAEFEKGLGEKRPGLMMEALERSDAIRVDSLYSYSGWSTCLRHVTDRDSMEVRFALLARGFIDADYEQCKIPKHLARVSKSVNIHLGDVINYASLATSKRLTLLMALRAFNNVAHMTDVLKTSLHFIQDDLGFVADWSTSINTDLAKLKSVDVESVAKANPKRVKEAIFDARVKAMAG